MEMAEGMLYSMPQFPQLSVGGQPAWFRVSYPYSPIPGCSSPCTSPKPHLVPQWTWGLSYNFFSPVVFLKQLLQLKGLSVPGAGTEHMGL